MTSTLNIAAFHFFDERKDLVRLARTAETVGRYDDMAQFAKQLVHSLNGRDLDSEERSLFETAYSNASAVRRAALRMLNSGRDKDNALVDTYTRLLEQEFSDLCKEVLALLTEILIPATVGTYSEPEAAYLKSTGDYYRYLAEFVLSDENGRKSAAYYEQALQLAERRLSPTHPIRLGIALNYAVCNYEILKDQQKAREIAKTAFDDAISKLDQLDEASYKDSTLLMQLLRDNMTLWESEPCESSAATTS